MWGGLHNYFHLSATGDGDVLHLFLNRKITRPVPHPVPCPISCLVNRHYLVNRLRQHKIKQSFRIYNNHQSTITTNPNTSTLHPHITIHTKTNPLIHNNTPSIQFPLSHTKHTKKIIKKIFQKRLAIPKTILYNLLLKRNDDDNIQSYRI